MRADTRAFLLSLGAVALCGLTKLTIRKVPLDR